MTTVKTDIDDYALPMMRVEKCLQDMHNDLLGNDYDAALVEAAALVAEARILSNVILLMKEQKNGIRK